MDVNDRQGLCSIPISWRIGCPEEFQFVTSSSVQGLNGGHQWECNLTAVWGQMATGGGHAPLIKSMAVLGIPSWTKKASKTIEKHIGDWWRTLLNGSMKQAGKEEKAIALPTSRYSRYNISRITVMVAGANVLTKIHIMPSLVQASSWKKKILFMGVITSIVQYATMHLGYYT